MRVSSPHFPPRQSYPHDSGAANARAVARAWDLEVAHVTPDTRFVELGVDSLEDVEFALEVEAEFGVSVPDAEVARLTEGTVRDAVAYVEERLRS